MYIDKEFLGKRIAQRRKDMGLKQNQLAEMVEISNNHLSNIENGHIIPSLDVFINICTQLDTSPDMFLLGATRTSDLSQNLINSIKLCNEKSLKLLEDIVECLLKNQ